MRYEKTIILINNFRIFILPIQQFNTVSNNHKYQENYKKDNKKKEEKRREKNRGKNDIVSFKLKQITSVNKMKNI